MQINSNFGAFFKNNNLKFIALPLHLKLLIICMIPVFLFECTTKKSKW